MRDEIEALIATVSDLNSVNVERQAEIVRLREALMNLECMSGPFSPLEMEGMSSMTGESSSTTSPIVGGGCQPGILGLGGDGEIDGAGKAMV